jgi:hypothetical protein
MKGRGVISLTYDGTQMGHAEIAVPDLDDFGLKGSFYADPATLLDSYSAWRTAQSHAHEIGNGSLIGAALPDGSLPAWTFEMIIDDIAEANDLIAELFPAQVDWSLGLPIGRPTCADEKDYGTKLRFAYPAIRSGQLGVNSADQTAASHLRCVDPHSLTGSQLCEIARQAIQKPLWIVFAFDGIGAGTRSIDRSAHRELCDFLSQSQDLVHIEPVIAAAIRLNQSKKPMQVF